MNTNKVIQIAILVHDCKKTAENWAKFLNVEAPFILASEGSNKTNAVYKGKPCEGRIYQACFDFENVQIEIIQPIGEEPSVWKDCLDEMGECIHHIAFYTKDIKGDMKALSIQGLPSLQYGEWHLEELGAGSGKYSYHDAREKLGIIFELVDF